VTFESLKRGHGSIMGSARQAPELRYRGQVKVGIEGDGAHELIAGTVELAIAAAKVALERVKAGAFFRRGELRIRQRASPCRLSSQPGVSARVRLAHNRGGFLIHRTHRCANWFQARLDGGRAGN
jgi:hypothetical protein